MQSEQQKIQESEYKFPYHYLPRVQGGQYTQSTTLNWGHEYFLYIRFVVDLIATFPNKSLLDVGCGDGRLLFEIEQSIDNRKIVGIDTSKRAIDLAKSMSPNVQYICGDVTDATLFEEKFDVVTLIETLEHIPPDFLDKFLQGVNQHLALNGNLIITVPSTNVPLHRKHYQHFSLDKLTALIRPHFEIEKHFYLNSRNLVTKYLPAFLSNRFYTLNSPALMNRILQTYEKRFLIANENNGARICIVCQKT